MYIVFEGPDFSGKSSTAKLVEAQLTQLNKEVVTTNDPGGTAFGMYLREFMVSANCKSLDPLTQVLLFMSIYNENLKQIILPALETDKVVIGDRSCLSTIVYQKQEGLEPVYDAIVDLLKHIDLVFIFYCDYNTFRERLNRAKVYNSRDLMSKEEYETLVQKYLSLKDKSLLKENARYVLVNTSHLDEQQALEFVMNEITKQLGR